MISAELDLLGYGDFPKLSRIDYISRRKTLTCTRGRKNGDYFSSYDALAASPHEYPNLSPCIWSSLPSELVERILACLPMASLFKFRAVCRSWNMAPFEPVFRSLRAQLTMIPEAWLLMLAAASEAARGAAHHGKGRNPKGKGKPNEKGNPSVSCSNWPSFLFNLQDNKLVALPDTFLPFPPHPGCFSYCAAAGGLICYHHHAGFHGQLDQNTVSLWVGNPFTKEWKCLPPTIGSFPLNFPLRGLAGMVVLNDSCTGYRSNHKSSPLKLPVHYKLIVRTGPRNTWGSAMITEEYDSLTNQWRVTATGNVPLDHRMEQVVHCNGSLYFLTWQMRDGIYAYHMEKQIWMQILPPQARGYGQTFTSPHMVECCGELVLVSGVGRHHTMRVRGVRKHHMRTTGIELWRREDSCPSAAASPPTGIPQSKFLTMSHAASTGMTCHGSYSSTWSSLGSMPDDLVHEFVVGSVQFHCTSIRNQIYLTNNVNMLIFDMVLRQWQRVIITELPVPVHDFVSFVPKLEASP